MWKVFMWYKVGISRTKEKNVALENVELFKSKVLKIKI